tara:strand:- start:123 stop:782 length:660 start_codon:yes stop_codon:yes gene_type:complete
MKAENIILLIKKPNTIQDSYISSLDNIILKYPYFQIGQILLTKGLLNTESIRYNQQLKKAAIYSGKRKKLFNLISLEEDNQNEDTIVVKEVSKSTNKELEIGNPLQFSKDEHHSFSEWLALLNVKKIKQKKNDLIDDFIDKEESFSTPKKEVFFKATENSKKSLVENHDLVTPTLAKVYLEQEHYEKAISAYKKLILKYPKKSSFFANQIELITKLNKK